MYDVQVVMPVYNESECIADVLTDWIGELEGLALRFNILVLNDGSQDSTAHVLAGFAENPNVTVVNKENSGHGPTILQGYRMAVERAGWVFQVDSDNEMEARHFRLMWDMRKDCDAVIGIRDGRTQPIARKLISAVSRCIVRLLYGRGVEDVNCPFRLMRSHVLKNVMRFVPDNTFAPNVSISGLLLLAHKKVLNVPIPYSGRSTGEVSIKKWKLFKAAAAACFQTATIRINYKHKYGTG